MATTTGQWRATDWITAGVRLVVLLVLLAGGGSVVLAAFPDERSEQDLVADLDAGRVTHLEYQRDSGVVNWSVDGWRWRQARLAPHPPTINMSAADPNLQWLQQRIEASGDDVTLNVRVAGQREWWPSRVMWSPLQGLTVLAWAGTFVLMLATPRHRYGNRWAWFWLFTIGQVGAPLYLLLETRPLWRDRAWSARTPANPVSGGVGCLWSILLPIAASLVLFAVTASV
ncbi:hypothetical protein KZZ52_14910 [Dactylosporangium sp. AC04546]|uniref:hypothetical protein n=1 Tax=Dactylosporangium sp. AC04546 TaxID=2862460 RepID=UPI001EE08D35|nr:hypothetical protein [Dactylosporangium sp. AC04546]WVK86602.1 hypothetical protein KZZ52_14910 [Dactylosporangium sp. AC04546]